MVKPGLSIPLRLVWFGSCERGNRSACAHLSRIFDARPQRLYLGQRAILACLGKGCPAFALMLARVLGCRIKHIVLRVLGAFVSVGGVCDSLRPTGGPVVSGRGEKEVLACSCQHRTSTVQVRLQTSIIAASRPNNPCEWMLSWALAMSPSGVGVEDQQPSLTCLGGSAGLSR